jgi:hypothetical protein
MSLDAKEASTALPITTTGLIWSLVIGAYL